MTRKPSYYILLMLFVTFVSLKGFTALPGNSEIMPSMEWQKIQLQEKISNKIKKGLSAIIKSNQYIVDVEVIASEPTTPDFNITGKPPKKVRYSNKEPDASSKDYIVFSKLGLEAPVISEFDPEQNKKSDFEYLWRYNQSMDIFKNLESVTAYISLSQRLLPETRDNVQKMLEGLKFNFGDLKPEMKISYIDMDEKVEAHLVGASATDIIDLVSKFSNMIGLIIAALFLGLIAYILFKRYEQLKENEAEQAKQAAIAAAQGEGPQEEKEEEEEDEEDKALAGLPEGFTEEDKNYSGINRFKAFLEKAPIEAGLLVKKWLKSDDGDAQKALVALVQQLETSELMKVFEVISIDERENWKELLEKSESVKDLVGVNEFISKQIVEDIIVPPVILDSEITDVLLSLKEEAAAKFIREQDDLGGVLMNIMSTKYISAILEHLEPREAEKAIDQSLKFDKNNIEDILPRFKEKIMEYQSRQEKNPFIKKIVELIPLASPGKESALFSRLAKIGEIQTLKDIAQEFFPADLIPKLPKGFMHNLFRALPMKKRTELVASMGDEHMRDYFVSIFAPDGSTAKDMLDLELEKYDEDYALKKKVEEDAEKIWKEFVNFVRKHVRNDKNFGKEIDEVLVVWIDELQGGKKPLDPSKKESDNTPKAA